MMSTWGKGSKSRVIYGGLELRSSAEVVVGFVQFSVSRKGHGCEFVHTVEVEQW